MCLLWCTARQAHHSLDLRFARNRVRFVRCCSLFALCYRVFHCHGCFGFVALDNRQLCMADCVILAVNWVAGDEAACAAPAQTASPASDTTLNAAATTAAPAAAALASTTESLIAADGVLQGTGPKTPPQRRTSRLSRRALFAVAATVRYACFSFFIFSIRSCF